MVGFLAGWVGVVVVGDGRRDGNVGGPELSNGSTERGGIGGSTADPGKGQTKHSKSNSIMKGNSYITD